MEQASLLQRNLINFKPEYKLQEAILILIVYKGFMGPPSPIQTSIFREIDEDLDGKISV
jgi:hypothetical protein